MMVRVSLQILICQGRKPKPSVAVIQSIVVRTSRIVAASGLVGVGHVPVRWSLIG
jgi:hypothetical protein